MTRLIEFRLLPAAVAGWAVASWAVTGHAIPSLRVGALLAVASLGLLYLGARRRLATSLAVLMAVSAFVLVMSAIRASGTAELKELADSRLSATVVGRVDSDPSLLQSTAGPSRYTYRVAVESARRPWEDSARTVRGVVKVYAAGGTYSNERPVQLGSRIELTGRVAPADPGLREIATLQVKQSPAVISSPAWVFRAAEVFRTRLVQSCEGLPADARGLVPAMVTGDTSEVPADLTIAMRDSGLAHLTAVSGTNVTIVCGTVILAIGLLRLGPRWQAAAAVVALVCFVMVARPQPSVVRAATMGSVGLLGLIQGRRGVGIAALSASVVTLCVLDPWLSRELGFVLSVAATASIVILGRPVTTFLSRVMSRPLAAALAVPMLAQLICGPILVLVRTSVGIYSVPANLLAAPAVASTTVLGCAALVVASIWPAGGAGLAWIAGWGASWIAWVGRTSAGLPGATIAWRSGWSGFLLLLASGLAVLGLVAGLVLLDSRWRLRRHLANRWRSSSPSRRTVLAAVLTLAVLAGFGVVRLRMQPWPLPGWRIVACDVGQGDGLVLATSPGHAVVVDVGPAASPIKRCLDRLRISTIDLLVLTHFHADHVGGIEGALDSRSVARVLVSPLASPTDGVRYVGTVLSRRGISPEVGAQGMTGTQADLNWEVIYPPATAPGPRRDRDADSSSANNASLTMVFRAPGLTIAALGDLEPPAQDALGEVPVVDVVKVAHHGSRYQEPDLYRRLAPRLALISVGAGNDFGHPSPTVLRLLEAQQVMVRRTDTAGDVAVGSGSDGQIWVRGAHE